MLREKRSIDDDENSFFIENIDVDGIQIVEKNMRNKVYIYYSEIPILIDLLNYYKKEYYDKNL